MNIVLIDLPDIRSQLFPFTLTRPIGTLRVGILTIQEKWQQYIDGEIDVLTDIETINEKFQKGDHYHLAINSSVIPDQNLANAILELEEEESLHQGDHFLAAKVDTSNILFNLTYEKKVEYLEETSFLTRPWDIFSKNAEEINKDFEKLTTQGKSTSISDPHTIVYGRENLHISKGVKIKAAIINAENGPVYLDEDSEIQEGCIIKGPFYLGKGSKINAGAVIREGCSFGPGCKVGGEVSNSVLYANSNKAHDGFLGNSVLGEFCNLGAATNNSNLKNNYNAVKMWADDKQEFTDSGLQFCGLMMGDHSKSAIGTTFNTGTTVGVHCNVFGEGFPKKYIPSFSWGGNDKLTTHDFSKAMLTAEKVMTRRNTDLTETDKNLFQSIFDATQI